MTRLESWRNVITPHPDIADGKFNHAEFMADLGNAVNGTAGSEYTDAGEFFRRTKLTAGLRDLLVKSLKRVCGQGGEPVIQIKTAFGGGKTHSMIALYHLMNAGANIEGNAEIRGVFESAGVFVRPRVKVAVLACTGLAVSDPVEVCGLKVNTLWGNMAAQLGGYEYVRSADMLSVAPGNSALVRMFNECGPCVVLIDELVAYGRKLLKESEAEASGIRLPAGTFGNLLTFIQELTEAAKFSKNSLVAATLPESKDESGSEQGMEILHMMGHIFGRIESVWKPITASEGFEIVRKRLFLECHNPAERERTADEFMRMYESNPSDFPSEARDSAYRQRLIECYPFHPELFDRLYGDWATLGKFQRTRGVLRFLANVVRRLWTDGDMNALIMPGSLPLWDFEVREGLVTALPEGDAWNPIVEHDIDGDISLACRIDGKERFAQISAARRTARAIMLGSAPAGRTQALRGIDGGHIRLGSVQPGENISSYNDAVNELKKELSYLYADDSRLWFDTRPTLKRTAKGLAEEVKAYEVSEEVTRRLKKLMQREEPFAGVHVCVKDYDDVPDDQKLRLVVLGLDGDKEQAKKILNTKMNQNQPRVNRNMLVFLLPDGVQLEGVRAAARSYLAWRRLDTERERWNLDQKQVHEVKESLTGLDRELDGLIVRAWESVLCGHMNRDDKFDDITLESFRRSDTGGDIAESAALCLRKHDRFSEKWAANSMSMTLDNLKWDGGEAVPVKTLWEWVCRYCYMPRLKNFDALMIGIREGVAGGMFGLASSKDGGKYTNLRMNSSVILVNESDLLVKKDIAEKQIEAEKTAESETKITTINTETGTETPTPDTETRTETPKAMRRFRMSDDLKNHSNPQRHVKEIFDDIIAELTRKNAGELKISLEVIFNASSEIDTDTVKAISDNCKAIHVSEYRFEA